MHVNGNGPGNQPFLLHHFCQMRFSFDYVCIGNAVGCPVFLSFFLCVKWLFFSVKYLLFITMYHHSHIADSGMEMVKVGSSSVTKVSCSSECWLIVIYFYMSNESWLPREQYVLILTKINLAGWGNFGTKCRLGVQFQACVRPAYITGRLLHHICLCLHTKHKSKLCFLAVRL